jgi:acyl dehydratase
MAQSTRQGMFFEEFSVGQVFETGGRTVTDADVVLFAGISGDFTRLHLDEEYAKASIFKGRVAHGMLAVSIATGLLVQLGTLEGTAMSLLEFTCRFTAPVHLNDTVSVRQTVTEVRQTSKPDRGIVTFALELLNQHGETAFAGSEKIMVRRRT